MNIVMHVLFIITLCGVYSVTGDPCVVPGVTWESEDIIDIIEDIADYTTCQDACASPDHEQCNYFTWYNSEHDDSPSTCIFFQAKLQEISCEHCISGPAICSTRDLLVMGDSLLLEIPNFTPAMCTLASYPERGIQYAVSGTADARHIICGGRGADGSLLSSCYSLIGNSWSKEADLAIARSGAAASKTDAGLMVTGGYGVEGYLASSEMFKENAWVAGPPLPVGVEGHCQVQIGDNVIVVGGFPGASPSGAAYALDGDSWTSLGELTTPRGWHACSFQDNELYVIGGYNGTYLSSTEVLDLVTGTWRAGPDLPYPAYDGRAIHYDGEMYLVGGYGSDGRIVRLSSDADAWDDVANTGDTGTRTWAPALVVSSDMINC